LNDIENKLKEVLKAMNDSFKIEVTVSEDIDDEQIAHRLIISEKKNDCEAFLESFCSLFGPLITAITNEEKELVYQEDTGLVIQHKNIIDDNLVKKND